MKIHLVKGIDSIGGTRCIQATVLSERGELSFPFGWGMYLQHADGRREIVVAKQRSVFLTLEILLHELGHWILEYIPIMTQKQWDVLLKISPSNIYGEIKELIKTSNMTDK